MDIYENLQIGPVKIVSKNIEESKRRQRPVWVCFCSKCGKTKSIEGRCITEDMEDCGCGKRARASETKRKRLLESANSYIGTTNDRGTEYLGVDEVMTEQKNTIMLSCRCGVCKQIYFAPLNQIRVGKYPVCSYCTRKKNDFTAFKQGGLC